MRLEGSFIWVQGVFTKAPRGRKNCDTPKEQKKGNMKGKKAVRQRGKLGF